MFCCTSLTMAQNNDTVGNDTVAGNDTASGNNTTAGNETTTSDNTTDTEASQSLGVIELDPNNGCYIPGEDDDKMNMFKNSPEKYKMFADIVGEKRREAQQNFTPSTILEEVPEVERSILPSEEIIKKMFPDLGDGFVVETWLASLSKITMKAMRDIKNSTATKMTQRYETAEAIKMLKSKFDYSSYTVVPTETQTNAEEVVSNENPESNSNSSSTNTTDALNRRKRNFEITTTTLVRFFLKQDQNVL